MNSINQFACHLSTIVFWAGFFKGIAFTCCVIATIEIYKYFKKNSLKTPLNKVKKTRHREKTNKTNNENDH